MEEKLATNAARASVPVIEAQIYPEGISLTFMKDRGSAALASLLTASPQREEADAEGRRGAGTPSAVWVVYFGPEPR